jgi:Tfp pilus assembly protein PilV
MINYQKGQSLIELLVALAVLVLTISAITFLVLDSYVAYRAGREHTLATFLAEEGLEAARSIRDNNWDDLVDGNHGIAISGDSWIFQGTENDLSGQLRQGKREVIINTLDVDRKEIQSKVSWEFNEVRSQEVVLVSYLTNWQKEIPSEGCWGTGGFCDSLCQHSSYGSLTDYYTDPGCSDICLAIGSFYLNPSGACSNDGTGSCYKMEASITQDTSCSQSTDCETGCGGTCTPCDQFDNQPQCINQLGCEWKGNRCRGTCEPCQNFFDPISCPNQAGCSWEATKWLWNLADSQDGSPSYITCEWYVQ